MYALLVQIVSAFSGLSGVWQAQQSHLTATSFGIPEVCQEVLDDWRGNDITNVLCITARKGLESNAYTLPNFIEHRPTCDNINHMCHVGG